MYARLLSSVGCIVGFRKADFYAPYHLVQLLNVGRRQSEQVGGSKDPWTG
jgi:hypothetical protein